MSLWGDCDPRALLVDVSCSGVVDGGNGSSFRGAICSMSTASGPGAEFAQYQSFVHRHPSKLCNLLIFLRFESRRQAEEYYIDVAGRESLIVHHIALGSEATEYAVVTKMIEPFSRWRGFERAPYLACLFVARLVLVLGCGQKSLCA